MANHPLNNQDIKPEVIAIDFGKPSTVETDNGRVSVSLAMGMGAVDLVAAVLIEELADPELALATETQYGRWPNVCQNDATHTWHITDWVDGNPDGNPPTQPNNIIDNGDWVECVNTLTPPTTPPPTTAKPTTTPPPTTAKPPTTTAKPTTTPPTTPRTTPPATNPTTTVEVVTTPATTTTVQASTTEQATTTEAASTSSAEDSSTTTLSPEDTAETSGASPTDESTTTVHVSTASKDGSGGGVSGETIAMGGGSLIFGTLLIAALARRIHKHGHRQRPAHA